MDTKAVQAGKEKIIKKENPLGLDVLNIPSRSVLISMPSPSREYQLYHYSKCRINIAIYQIEISKARLLMNLQTYEWRKQTDFPIVKTRYINIKNQSHNPNQKVQMEVWNQYCPLRLNHIYEMSISQAVYIIKECLIGFERLFNRFGGFQIQETMIAINQKGYCRVWVNQNFACNQIIKRENSQMKMVHKIIQIIQAHCIESKSSKRLFTAFSKCSNFLQSLKMVDGFVMTEKILVPSRFSFFNPNKEKKKNQTFDSPFNSNYSEFKKPQNPRRQRINEFKTAKEKRNISISPDANLMSFRSLSPSQSQIKRFKSQNKTPKIESMKVSEGETAYSANNRDVQSTNLGGNYSYSREASIIQPNKTQRSKGRRKAKWIQESSFLMDFQQKKPEVRREKKQLSQSQAVFIQVAEPRDRKYSANNFHSLGTDAFYKFSSIKNSQNDNQIKNEISQMFNDSESSRTRPIMEEEDETKKVQHENKILEQNGWKSFQNLLKIPEGQGLKQSFHSGEQQKHPKSEVKLQKLENLNKRKIAMSILPEDYAEDCL